MKVERLFFVNNKFEKLMFDDLRNSCRRGRVPLDRDQGVLLDIVLASMLP